MAEDYISYTGCRVLLRHKLTNEEVHGVVVEDHPGRVTRFRLDSGRETTAHEWFWTIDDEEKRPQVMNDLEELKEEFNKKIDQYKSGIEFDLDRIRGTYLSKIEEAKENRVLEELTKISARLDRIESHIFDDVKDEKSDEFNPVPVPMVSGVFVKDKDPSVTKNEDDEDLEDD